MMQNEIVEQLHLQMKNKHTYEQFIRVDEMKALTFQ